MSCASSSCSSVVRVLVLLLLVAAPAAAQTADEFFDGATLHDIQLVVNSRDWQRLKDHFELDTYFPCNVSWRGVTARDAAIRSRGFGSRSGTKPGLRVEFDRYRTGGEFLGLRSLVLDNLTQDPSMIRERVSMLLFNRMGWPAPREAHARVFVNGEYAGLYASVEDIDEQFLQRAFGVPEETLARSGYLFEYRWHYRYTFTYLGPDLEDYEQILDPKIKAHLSRSELFAPIEDLIRTVNETSEANFTRVVGEFLDLRALMTYLAIENFLAEWDGFLGDFGMNNFYVARLEPRRFARLIPWDKDNAIAFELGNPSRAIEQSAFHNFSENILAKKAIASPELREAYLDDLLTISDVAAGWLEDEIVREFQLIRAAAMADPFKPFSNEQFEEAIAYLLRFARERPDVMRAQVAAAHVPIR